MSIDEKITHIEEKQYGDEYYTAQARFINALAVVSYQGDTNKAEQEWVNYHSQKFSELYDSLPDNQKKYIFGLYVRQEYLKR